jgi:hypothetical protein
MTLKHVALVAAAVGSFIGGLYVGLHNDTPHAAPQDLWREEVLRELGEIKGDVRVIKCRLGIEGICPPGEPK